MLPTIAAALVFVAPAFSDDISLLRIDAGKAGQPLWLESHAQGQTANDIVGSLKGSDNRFLKASGGKPVRHAFSAQWDGAGASEVVVIREFVKKPNHPLELRVYRVPAVTGGSAQLVASSKAGDLGFTLGSGRVVAIARVDVEPDGKDEVALVREWGGGQRFLEIRRLPKGKKKAMGPPVASDPAFGSSADDEIVAMAGLDADGDFRDELALLRRPAVGPDRIEEFEIPTLPGGDTGPSFASCLDVTPAGGGTNLGMSSARLGEVASERLLLLRRDSLGADRIELFEAPTIPGDSLVDPLAQDVTLGLAGFDVPVFAAFGVESAAKPPPWQAFDGPWALSLRVRYGAPEQVEEWVGPFEGCTGAANSQGVLTLTLPNSTTQLIVHLASYDDGAATDLGEDPWYSTLEFFSPIQTGVVRVDDIILVTYTDGQMVYGSNGRPYIGGIAPQAWSLPYIGEVQKAPDYIDATASVIEYKFVKQ